MFTHELSKITPRSSFQVKWLIMLLIGCSGLGGMLYGYDIGVISGAIIFIKKSFLLTDTQLGLVVGAVLIGSLIGTFAGGCLADFMGRCKTIILGSLICIVGVLITLYTTGFTTIFLARLLLGLGTGVVWVVVPLYISEIAPAEIRGKSVTVFQLFLTLGILLAYIVDFLFDGSGNWHAMFALMLIPSIALLLAMIFLPESPRWLLAKQKTNEAIAVLVKIRPLETVNNELMEIVHGLNTEEGGWGELFSRKMVMPLFISLSVAACNQLTGINVFLQYAPLLLQKAGFSSHSVGMLGTIGIGTINFITTLVAMKLIDKVGRKKLLVYGIAGVLFAEIFIALVMYSGFSPIVQGSLSLLGLLIFICSFAIGPGVVVWLAISELFPTKVRGKGATLGLLINSLTATILSTLFLNIVHSISLANTYLLFAGFTLYYWFIAYYLLPETKGQSLESIQQHFRKKTADIVDGVTE